MTWPLLLVSAGPPGPAGPTTAVPGQPSTTQPSTTVPGPQQDSADFYGLFGAVAIIIGAIIVIRLAFRRPRRPPAGRGPAAGQSPPTGPSPPAADESSGDQPRRAP
ncbi:MAG: hypothetical protein ACR2MN_14630 [Acidimicrobiales bacterium]